MEILPTLPPNHHHAWYRPMTAAEKYFSKCDGSSPTGRNANVAHRGRMQLTGFHHLTAVTADAPRNHAFYTKTLGLRLVKKTVNQDDVSAYHLFYADGLASPGTDITFFDWPVGRERRGTQSIVRTGFRVDSTASLE